jgi:hypothetical protein
MKIIRAAWRADRNEHIKSDEIWNVMPGSRLAADYLPSKLRSPLTFWLGSFSEAMRVGWECVSRAAGARSASEMC